YKEFFLRLGAIISLRNPLNTNRFHNTQITWKWMSKGLKTLDNVYDVAIAYSQGNPTYFVAEKVHAHKKISWINTDYHLAGYNKSFDEHFYDQFDHIVAVSEYNK